MAELRTSLIIDLAGNLQGTARKFSSELSSFASQGQRHLSGLQRTAELSGKALNAMGNRYTALLSGGGLGLAMRNVGNFETRLTRLGIDGQVSDAKLKGLKNSLFEISQERDIGIDPKEALSGIEEIILKTGDLKFAEDNLRNIAIAISATGASGKDIGGMMAEFQKMGIKGSQDVLKSIDILNVQGKMGAFTLQNLAALGPRVVSAYTAAGRGGVESLREMGAALQMIRQGTGSSEMAASAFEATMRTLTDPQKIKQLKQLTGIQVFDVAKLAEGHKVLRPINEVMAEIIKKTKGDVTKLGLVFDAEAMRAFNSAASEFQRTGQIESLERYYKVHADGSTTLADSRRAAATYAGAMNRLSSIWLEFSNNNLAGPVQDLSDALNSVKPGTVQRWLETGKYVALALGGLVALQKVKGLFDARAAAAATSGGPAPIPVYIVNGVGGAGGAPVPTGAGGGSKAAKLAGAAQGLLFAGTAGYAAGSLISDAAFKDDSGRNNDAGQFVGRNIARVMALFGNDAAQYAVAAEREAAMAQPMEGHLSIKIDAQGNASVTEMQGSNLKLSAETGRTMGG